MNCDNQDDLFENLSRDDLKNECKLRKLPMSGNMNDLRSRLKAHQKITTTTLEDASSAREKIKCVMSFLEMFFLLYNAGETREMK